MSDDLGQTIRLERERRGWSQEFLAAKVGATQSTIDRIENGLTRKSRVLPEIMAALDLSLPGIEKKPVYVAPVGGFSKVAYVLPTELVERIEKYKVALGVSSDDEIVRRIIDDFLKKRDDVVDIVSRIMQKFKLTRSIREAAGIILANHPLVPSMSFENENLSFIFNDPFYDQLEIVITGWGVVSIQKEDGSSFKFHKTDAPKWASSSNITDSSKDSDYVPF